MKNRRYQDSRKLKPCRKVRALAKRLEMLQKADKEKVTKAISDLGRRVTAADVATKTGMPVLVVSHALNQIAAETNGRIAVSHQGDVLYSFSLGFSNVYLTEDLRHFLEKAILNSKRFVLVLVKISFGVMLAVSFFIIVFFFTLLLNFNKGQSGRSRKQGAAQAPRVARKDIVMLQQIFKSALQHTQQEVHYDYNYPTSRARPSNNFLLNCFSVLFGDGDPNEGLAEKRWQLIAKVIKQHDNVITAEQLAPYTGADPRDEEAVLPILVRFNGKPEVTESGNIVYTFPDLVSTAAVDPTDQLPAFLREFPCQFTEVEERALKPVYMMAALNFIGSWLLWFLLANKHAPSISTLFGTLVIYGTLFVAVPICRYLALNFINKRIEFRNARRAELAANLLAPAPELQKKLTESRDYRLRHHRIASNNIIYTTDKNSLEQDDDLSLQFKGSTLKAGDIIDAKPEETFDASPAD